MYVHPPYASHPSCNEYDLKDYLPVYVGDEPVGYAHLDFVSELTLLQQGAWVGMHVCMIWLVDARGFLPSGWFGVTRTLIQTKMRCNTGQGVRVEMDSYVELAPGADTPEKRTR